MTTEEQCKEPVRFTNGKFNGCLFCLLKKGHDGMHEFRGFTS